MGLLGYESVVEKGLSRCHGRAGDFQSFVFNRKHSVGHVCGPGGSACKIRMKKVAVKLSPLTIRKIKRFRSIKRGYYAFILFALMVLASFGAELLVNSRALIVHYDGGYYFPTYWQYHPREQPSTATTIMKPTTVNWRLTSKRKAAQTGLLLPPVPYNPYENDLKPQQLPPMPPSFADLPFPGHRHLRPGCTGPGWYMDSASPCFSHSP